jgi:serine/threonine protein phosphatase 1
MELTYAVGDIHGCHDLLIRLLEAIEIDAHDRVYTLVFLGDYIDQGTDSVGVIDTLMRLQSRLARSVICLKGNHECLMLEALAGEIAEAKWLAMGGGAVLSQYDVSRAADLPAAVLAWLDSLPTYHEDESRYFVHAGVDPASPLSAQADVIRMSMRGVFIEQDHDFGKHIVHGHTPQLSGLPDLRRYRTNLDTGVVSTGRLTGAVFEPMQRGPRRIIQARADGAVVVSEPEKLRA